MAGVAGLSAYVVSRSIAFRAIAAVTAIAAGIVVFDFGEMWRCGNRSESSLRSGQGVVDLWEQVVPGSLRSRSATGDIGFGIGRRAQFRGPFLGLATQVVNAPGGSRYRDRHIDARTGTVSSYTPDEAGRVGADSGSQVGHRRVACSAVRFGDRDVAVSGSQKVVAATADRIRIMLITRYFRHDTSVVRCAEERNLARVGAPRRDTAACGVARAPIAPQRGRPMEWAAVQNAFACR
ncbi:hypothetical protein DFR74_10428 [Nocardia puris]|uniref:Uncharacterized protein n=1 Tax=Nocardia puris TaxID=208602 RepID=A0A366DMQ2_9NOCA|nr:hypothetical protein DFR74_10428 [Nocardia puris]